MNISTFFGSNSCQMSGKTDFCLLQLLTQKAGDGTLFPVITGSALFGLFEAVVDKSGRKIRVAVCFAEGVLACSQ